jgi:hypothetical protein
MGRFERRDRGQAASGGRWRRLRLPAGGPATKRIAAIGAVAVLGLTVHTGLPAAASRFRGTGPYLTAPDHVGNGGPASISATSPRPGSQASQGASQASAFRQIILPDLLIVAPKGLTPSQVARLRKITGVRDMITFDGAQITAGGRPVSVIGVDPATFRSWVPLGTATDQALWSALGRGQFLADQAAGSRLRLRAGASYQLTGATSQVVRYAMSAPLGLAGVDLLVNQGTSRKLGLVRQVAGLISAPADSLATLTSKVSAVLGPSGRIEVLRSQQLPVVSVAPGSRPTDYLGLFKASAAEYCPGLSWTVLAAIGQIESADGTNVGPSTAGAMGPMQFLPSTWAAWGIDGFGDTGTPNILNPYDAVPSAARLLCSDGAAAGGQSLYHAIFDYNHADWYVNEVLALAAEYAADYS